MTGGCGGSPSPARFETTSALSTAPRRPPGVAVDPAPELPGATRTAEAAQGLAVLEAPADPAVARDVVRDFLDAAVRESEQDMSELLDTHARIRTGSRGGSQLAVNFWRQRFARLDYGAFVGQLLYRESEIETYRARDLKRMRPPRRFALVARGDDVLIRVRISSPRLGRTRMFGDEILFLLRPTGTGYKIKEMREEFRIP